MAKPVKHDEQPEPVAAPAAAPITDVFAAAQKAYEVRGIKALKLAELRQQEAKAVAKKQAELDAVKAEHSAYVEAAQQDADAAQADLLKLQAELQDFIGRPDPRVSVK